ncbi:hypothetical protein DSO57_1023373 [Entomophthora muscae]|uniref:Uncharacterized protein n=1 Tax=Entomophthora muscae TaxID=34485 RepID=A0ACC2RU20_9FUNG|nr:hypothetical protein DSO57_1023373 [Entomophthora muscae]
MTIRNNKRRANLALFACDFCKHRKIRCTVVNSQCKECLVRGLHCTFLKSSNRKCYLRGQKQEKKEWKDNIISEPDSRPEEKAYQPNQVPALLGTRASELTFKEFKVLVESVSNSPSSSLKPVKDKLPLMVAELDQDRFRFLVNTMIAWHLFTSTEIHKPLTQYSSELNDGIAYYSCAVDAIPFIDIGDIILPVLTLLEEVRILSIRAIA